MPPWGSPFLEKALVSGLTTAPPCHPLPPSHSGPQGRMQQAVL